MRPALITASFFSLLTVLSPFTAAHENTPYIELGVGRSVASGDLHHAGLNSAGTPNYGVNYATAVGFAIGYQLTNGLRLEVDFRDRDIDVGGLRNVATRPQSAFIGAPEEEFNAGGTTNSRTRMLNIAYVGKLTKKRWTGYVKAGAGEAKNRAQATIDVQPTFGLLGEPALEYAEGSNREFAWSAGAGVMFHLRDRIELGIDYQYSNLGDADSEASIQGDNLEHDRLAVHELTARIRYNF